MNTNGGCDGLWIMEQNRQRHGESWGRGVETVYYDFNWELVVAEWERIVGGQLGQYQQM